MTRGPKQVASFIDELVRWAANAGVSVETVRYGDDQDQAVDLRGIGGRTALVLHGGFWRAGFTKRNTDALATALTLAGWKTANVEYRRLGPGAYRELLADVAAAARLLTPAIAVGHSAGGHLALWLTAEGLVGAGVSLGGVCDLADARRRGLGDNAVEEFLGGNNVPEVDPARRLPLGRPQLLVHGIEDDRVPLEHIRAYAAAAGAECRLLELEGAGHFDVIDPRSDVWPTIRDAIEGLVR